jgi:hypothetical protein
MSGCSYRLVVVFLARGGTSTDVTERAASSSAAMTVFDPSHPADLAALRDILIRLRTGFTASNAERTITAAG